MQEKFTSLTENWLALTVHAWLLYIYCVFFFFFNLVLFVWFCFDTSFLAFFFFAVLLARECKCLSHIYLERQKFFSAIND